MKIRYTKGPGKAPVPATLTVNDLSLVKGVWADCSAADVTRAAPFVADYGLEFKGDAAAAESPATPAQE